MERADDEFMYRHREFANRPHYDECDKDLVSRASDAVDDGALFRAIEDEFRKKLGLLNYNHYFLDTTGCPPFWYSPYDNDGGDRVIQRTYRLAEGRTRLSSCARIHTFGTQRSAQAEHQNRIARGAVIPIGEAFDKGYYIVYRGSCCSGYPWLVYLALHRTGNYLCGERVPEAVELLDRYKLRHAAECTGCRE